MIVQKDFLSKLKNFGLNTYESKLWTALLSRGISTAGELSDIASVPRSRSYDVLESLEKKGFIMMKVGKPIKYIAVHPEEVLERVKKRINEDTESRLGILNSIKETSVLKELNLLHNQGIKLVDPVELSGSLRGRSHMYNHLETMIKSAKESIIIMTTSKGLTRKAETFKDLFAKAKRRGVEIKIAAPLDDNNKDIAKELAKYGEVKHVEENSRFCVVDGREVMFMLMDDDNVHPSFDTGIWVNTKLFASTIENFFNSAWSNMKPTGKFLSGS